MSLEGGRLMVDTGAIRKRERYEPNQVLKV
jgi:hypothetical protein